MAISEPSSTVIEFLGSSGRAPSTWGQRAIWRSIRWMRSDSAYFNLQRCVAVPDGVPAEQVLAALRAVVERHEVLRTLFTDTTDCTVQEVVAHGAIAVTLRSSPDEPTKSAAAALAAELVSRPFRHEREFGLRLAVLSHGDAPRWIAIAVSHLIMDMTALHVVERDLTALLGGAELPPPRWTPRQEAERQADPSGAARGRAALRFWERGLTAVPRSHFDHPPAPGAAADDPERFLRLRLESPAGAVAASALADRCSTTTSVVLLAAAAVVLAGRSRHPVAALQLIAGNRNEDRLRELVGAQAENALFVLDLPDGDFEDAIRASYRPALSAYRHSGYDPMAWAELLDRVALRRGSPPDLAAFFNDARMGDRWDDLEAARGAEAFHSRTALEALAAKSAVRFIGSWPRQDARYFVHASYSPDALHLNLMADTHYLSRPELERLLFSMERLLLDSVFDRVHIRDAVEPELRVGRPADWILADGSWCDPGAVAHQVSEAAGGARVVMETAPTGPTAGHPDRPLTAVVTGGPEGLSIQELHARVVDGSQGAPHITAPQWYVLRTAAGLTVAEGSGRPDGEG
ncbi:condensation domain-containing protein [Streptomyces sp. NPDC091289]|uniref:condensation domain-containing protein n=1 Tax=Streptomyces sp. NPDC091289 TaxID=3365989 RepID=UPI0037F9A0BC